MNTITCGQVLKDTIRDEAPRILYKWNPIIDNSNEFGPRIKTRCIDIRLFCQHEYISVEFLSPTDISGNERIYLAYVIEAIAPELPDTLAAPKYVNMKNHKKIREETIRLLEIIANHCGRLLDCNEETWSALNKWRIDYGGRFQHPDMTKAEYIAILKRKADENWEKKNYSLADEFYERYISNGGHMSLKDKWHQYISSRATPPSLR